MSNIIPEIGAKGSFTAKSPFDSLCDPEIVYTVEAIRTVEEIRIAKVNVQQVIGNPAGLDAAQTQQLLSNLETNKGVMVTLAAPGVGSVHIPSTHFLSFPVIDGVAYERYFITIDLGVLPPDFKNGVNVLQTQLKEEVKAFTGVNDPVLHIGTIPTITYVSSQQHLVNETTRKNQITKDESYIERIRKMEEQTIKDKAYIALLESKVIEQAKK